MNEFQKVRLNGRRMRCCACFELFNSESAFNGHRVGEHGKDRHCLTPEQLLAKDWCKNKAGFWTTGANLGFAERAKSTISKNQ